MEPLRADPPDTIVEIVARHVLTQPTATAFTFLSGDETRMTLTFAELDTRARAIAVCLLERGLGGRPVLLLCPPGLDYVCSLVGAWYAGAIPVPAYPPSRSGSARTEARIATIAHDAGATDALTTAQTARLAASDALQLIECDLVSLARAGEWRAPMQAPEQPCLLQYTSGSTAEPKGVVVTHQNLLANEAMIQRAGAVCPDDVVLSWLPPYHDMGLIGGIIAPLYVGAHGVLMAPESFVRRPARWLQAMSELRVSVSMTPSFALDLCVKRVRAEDRAGLDLSSLRLLYNGAEPINPASIDAFWTVFAACGLRRSAIYPCYGLAEATLMVSGGDLTTEPVVREFATDALAQNRAATACDQTGTLRRLVGCGRAVSGTRLRIVDPQTQRELADQHIGELWVHGPAVASGYWRRPEETAATFQARIADTNEGPFLRTGDLGFFHDGELFVTGRLKDLIIIRGKNHHPQDIERTVQSVDPALLTSCGAAFSIERDRQERLVVVQELDHRAKPDPRALLERILEQLAVQHELAPVAILLIKKGSLPKTSSGKVQRRATRAAYLHAQLAVVDAFRLDAPQRSAPDSTRTRPLQRPDMTVGTEGTLRIATFLRERLAAIANISPDAVDERAPLAVYGVDSLVAEQLTEELEHWLGCKLSSSITHENPTVAELAHALAHPEALAAAARPRPPTAESSTDREADPIAIVGMACRFPGAPDLRGFWHMLRHGVDAITEVPRTRWDLDALYDADSSKPGKMSSRWGGFIEGVDQFDPQFFGISQHEAARMDPQQRLFLEVTWEALEDAGIAADRLAGTETGVFAGAATSDYALLYRGALQLVDGDYGPGNAPSVIANRVSYFLNLHGPSVTFDTACSSALVALQAACRSLRLGDSSLCIVGGVNAVLAPEPSIFFSKARALARDGRCKSFDASADGFVRSEGCGVVVLKKLSQARADGDRVYALVAGSAVNHGGTSNGLLAPNGPAQQRLIRRALADARLTPDALDYIEAHGVGAPLADVVEARALGAIFAERTRATPCLLGSVKSNLGHLEAASGIAGVIKTALALTHEEIPAQLHLYDVHPDIAIDPQRLAIPTVPTPWRRGAHARFAGVSAFGFGGTNAHVVLGEAPLPPTPSHDLAAQAERPLHVLALRARDPQALARLAERHARTLSTQRLGDLCFTASTGRAGFAHRAAFVAADHDELRRALESFARAPAAAPVTLRSVRAPRVAFVFPDELAAMNDAHALYETQPVFRDALGHAARVLLPASPATLLATLSNVHADSAALACSAAQYALSSLLRSWGITPGLVIGRGVGEYAAACTAGALPWETGLRLSAHRAELLRSVTPGGLVTRTLHELKTELRQLEYAPTSIPFVSGARNDVLRVGDVPGYDHWLAHLYHASTPTDGQAALAAERIELTITLGPSTRYRELLEGLAAYFALGGDVDWVAFDAPFARSKLSLPSYPFARQRCWLPFPSATESSAPAALRATGSAHPLLQRSTVAAPTQSQVVRKVPEDKAG